MLERWHKLNCCNNRATCIGHELFFSIFFALCGFSVRQAGKEITLLACHETARINYTCVLASVFGQVKYIHADIQSHCQT